MFAGFTPGLARLEQPILNPKFGKLFKLVGAGFPGKGTEFYELHGRTIIEGSMRLGFRTIGTGAVGWFNPDVPTGRHLSEDFQRYFYPGNSFSLDRQLDFIENELSTAGGDVFVFLNVGRLMFPIILKGPTGIQMTTHVFRSKRQIGRPSAGVVSGCVANLSTEYCAI